MLQDTCERLNGDWCSAPMLICGEDHRFTVAEQLRLAGQEHSGILLEPEGRNTAPAVALAALRAFQDEDDPLLLVLAADHAIGDVAAFQTAIKAAVPYAQKGKLVTYGIVPQGPETGYGYIRVGAELNNLGDNPEGKGFEVAEFVEKPDLATAKDYVSSGQFYWNSGMFLFKAGRYLDELRLHRPDILKQCELAIEKASVDNDFIRPDREAFLASPDDSIDYAIMEKTKDAVVVSMDCGWSDVGSWSALWDVSEKDSDGNTFKGDVISVESRNCFVKGDKKLIATVGLENTVIVESDDAIMVASKDHVQNVKQVVQQLKAEGRSEANLHRKVFRPWGWYDSIDSGERFQVKHIVVKPGAQLSLQMHHHRAEHWIVVRGTARVTRGDDVFLISENESTYIPLGTTHRLENPGAIPLEMIEVQSGSYLGEDDIVRFEDSYGR